MLSINLLTQKFRYMGHSTSSRHERRYSGFDFAANFYQFLTEWSHGTIGRLFHHYFVANGSLASVHCDGRGPAEPTNNLAADTLWSEQPRSTVDVLGVTAVGYVSSHA